MKKIKIKGLSNEVYSKGRIDIFRISLSEELVNNIQGVFEKLEFSKDVINNLDIHYPSTEGYYFFYNPKVKAHLFFERGVLNLIFDSNLPREKIILIMSEFFIFPGQE